MLQLRAAATLVLLVGLSSEAQETGTICGFVKDEHGQPASMVRVEAMYMGPHSGPYDGTTTDADGRYCIDGVRPGEYAMSADDPAKGYPLMNGMFYAEHAPEPRIIISPHSWHQSANWMIPYKAGFLIVHAIDPATGRAVQDVALHMAVRGSEELRYMRGSWGTDTPVLLPPNEEVYVTVIAGGYLPWPLSEGKGRLVKIQPGETLVLPVVLNPRH